MINSSITKDKTPIPLHLEIVDTIVQHTFDNQDILCPRSELFRILQSTIREKKSFETSDAFLKSPACISYLQVLLLAGLSMCQGLKISVIKSFHVKNNSVFIVWDSNVKDNFTFGKLDNNFKTFCQYYQKKVLGIEKPGKKIPTDITKKIHRQIEYYMDSITKSNKRISRLITNKSNLKNLLEDNPTHDTIFLIISALPKDDLNALFVHLNQFLPEELTLRSQDGFQLKLKSLFQSPSNDISYLNEKISIYFQIYFSDNHPVIKAITRTKTKEFLLKLIQNDKVYESVIAHLKSSQQNHTRLLMRIYKLLIKHLDKILK
ncbi:hypothetical protein ACFLZV_00555 [Candidatus Margulisiibacteriota bacterium]